VLSGRRAARRKGGHLKTRKKAKAREYLTPESQKALADRLARAEGHLRSVRQMVIDHRCADEILLQLAAVKAAINQTAASLIETEMRACVDSCMAGDSDERLERVMKALAAVLKSI
jgi:DNA-binding FrmR family transcriptional regulator